MPNTTSEHIKGGSGNGDNADSKNVSTYYASSTELADLGRERFDHDTAAFGDRDNALFARGPINIHQGRATAGMEAQVFAWNTFQYETSDRDGKEELKGDLHGGMLHRQNRAARGELAPPLAERGGRRGGRGVRGTLGGLSGRGGGMSRGGGSAMPDALIAGRKPDHEAPPLAKGIAEELNMDLFWNTPII